MSDHYIYIKRKQKIRYYSSFLKKNRKRYINLTIIGVFGNYLAETGCSEIQKNGKDSAQ